MAGQSHNLTDKQLDLINRLFEGQTISKEDLTGQDPQFLKEFAEIAGLDSLLMQVFQPTEAPDIEVEETKDVGILQQIRSDLQTMISHVTAAMTPLRPQYQWLGKDTAPYQWHFEVYTFSVGLKQAGDQLSLTGSIRIDASEQFQVRSVSIEHDKFGLLPEPATFRLQKNNKGAYFSAFIPSAWDNLVLTFYGKDDNTLIHQRLIQITPNSGMTDDDG